MGRLLLPVSLPMLNMTYPVARATPPPDPTVFVGQGEAVTTIAVRPEPIFRAGNTLPARSVLEQPPRHPFR